jgi:NDP-sugar pyrophosphorylase family protein
MRALVLAAGLGERVRPLTLTTPKPMLPVGGRALIHYPLMMLRRAGIADVAINLHHLGGEIQRGLGDGSALGLHITYSPEPTLLGTGGPLNALRDYLRGDTFVIANSDGILDLNLSAMIAFHRDRGSLATIALYQPDNPEAYSEIRVDGDSRIRQMRLLKRVHPPEFNDFPAELAGGAETLTSAMYCGAIVAEPAVLDLIPRETPWSLMEKLFAPMVAQGLPVFGWMHRGYFGTVDDVASYEALRRRFEISPPKLSFMNAC